MDFAGEIGEDMRCMSLEKPTSHPNSKKKTGMPLFRCAIKCNQL